MDELWLKIFPITLGPGKRLFAAGAIPAAFRLTDSKVSPKGVIIAQIMSVREKFKPDRLTNSWAAMGP